MANHKSAEKRARQAKRRQVFNSRTKNALHTIEKRLKKAVGDKKVDEAKLILVEITSKVDKAAKKGVIHARTASRKVSRLSKQVQTLLK